MIGLALTRYEFRGRAAMNLLIFLPMAAPGDHPRRLAALAVRHAGRGARVRAILVAHIMFMISFVVVTIRARLAGLTDRWKRQAWTLAPTT